MASRAQRRARNAAPPSPYKLTDVVSHPEVKSANPDSTVKHIQIGPTHFLVTLSTLNRMQNGVLKTYGFKDVNYPEKPVTTIAVIGGNAATAGLYIHDMDGHDYDGAVTWLLDYINTGALERDLVDGLRAAGFTVEKIEKEETPGGPDPTVDETPDEDVEDEQ